MSTEDFHAMCVCVYVGGGSEHKAHGATTHPVPFQSKVLPRGRERGAGPGADSASLLPASEGGGPQ